MGKKGQFGFGFMAIASVILIVAVIVIVLVAVNFDVFRGGKGVLETGRSLSKFYLLQSVLRSSVDENLNVADLVSLSFDDENELERLEKEIHTLFEGSDFYYEFFYYRQSGSDFHKFTKPNWIPVYDSEGRPFNVFDILNEDYIDENLAATVIASHNGENIVVGLKVLEGRPE